MDNVRGLSQALSKIKDIAELEEMLHNDCLTQGTIDSCKRVFKTIECL